MDQQLEQFIFPYDFPDNSLYSIAGIICIDDKREDPININYKLRSREYFIVSPFGDDGLMCVICKDKIDFDASSLEWIESSGGHCYRYEGTRYEFDSKYILKDKNDNYILGLKFANLSIEEMEYQMNYFTTLLQN